MSTVHILAVYDESTKAAVAVAAARDHGLRDVAAYTPTPDHAIERLLDVRVSPVRLFTLIGGLLGCASGFALPIYTVYDWPLITGGKPLISIPPFVVIAFELTILFGAIGGMIGFLALAGLPRLTGPATGHPRFTNDCFGVEVTCRDEQAPSVRALLEGTGAIEVRTDA